jgi:hypothetical protein
MNFNDLFTAYYELYRAEATIPSSTDDEYTIGMRLANEAVQRWANYDNTYWKELFSTYQQSGEGSTVVQGTTQYDAPEDMREAGGFIKIVDPNGNTVRSYPIIESHEAQFKIDRGQYCYFTGDPNNGFVLNINPAPDSAIANMDINFIYYRKPSFFTSGTDVTEMSNPYFVVHRMLANRFRASRNPYYNSAKSDAEDALRVMQVENNSGSWANPWKLQDNSGAQFGVSQPGSWSW